jgi:outer membrane lipoprotein-sorting protein
MRKAAHAATAALIACLCVAPAAGAQTVDELIAKNLEARGGEARLRAIDSMRIIGRVQVQGMELPMTVLAKRPNLMRQEMHIQDRTVITAFDGTTAWMINPMLGSEAPQQIEGPQADLTRDQADFDGSLMDYRKKGHTVELIKGEGPSGTEKLPDGTAVHHLKVTRKSGRVQHYYLDAESGIEVKQASEIEGPDGQTARIEQELSDYRRVDGLMVPHTVRSLMNGTPIVTMTVEKIEFGAAVDDSAFRMPGRTGR